MRRTNFYFSALSFSDSLTLLVFSLVALIAGNSFGNRYRAKFENLWIKKMGAKGAVCTPSARSGLYALLSAWNIGPGDEVLVTGFTCSAVSEPIMKRGAKPVYVDINPLTYAMDPVALETAITPNTKCIIVQHTFGIPAPVEEICNIVKKNGIKVIEDCALALGSKINGKWLGHQADASLWSFELSKTISVGWGGLVQINRDNSLTERVRDVINIAGVMRRFSASQRLFQGGLSGLLYRPDAGFARYAIPVLFRMGLFRRSADTPADHLSMPDDRQWKVLANLLNRLNAIIETSRIVVEHYQGVLNNYGYGTLVDQQKMKEVCLIRFPFQVKQPERFMKAFRSVGIEAGSWFSQPVSSGGLAQHKFGYISGSCPIAERVCKHIINLPVHSRMNEQDIKILVETLDEYLTNYNDEINF